MCLLDAAAHRQNGKMATRQNAKTAKRQHPNASSPTAKRFVPQNAGHTLFGSNNLASKLADLLSISSQASYHGSSGSLTQKLN